MKKTLLILATILLTAVSMTAEKSLVLQKTNGEEVAFLLGGNPMAYPEASVLMITGSGNEITVAYDDIKKFYYKDVATGIREYAEAHKAAFSFDGSCITATSETAGSEMRIYSLDGSLLTSVKADDNGVSTLSVSQLPAGNYVIRTNTDNFKFLKR